MKAANKQEMLGSFHEQQGYKPVTKETKVAQQQAALTVVSFL